MVNKVYIVWCKLNKSTDKFDLGVFIDKQKATEAMEAAHYVPVNFVGTVGTSPGSKVWITEYKLS